MTEVQLVRFGKPCVEAPHVDGVMIEEGYRFAFDNGWGASVIRGMITMGAWELGVLGTDGRLNYDHPVSQGDVVRGSEAEIAQWLIEIENTGHEVVDGEVVDGEVVEGSVAPREITA